MDQDNNSKQKIIVAFVMVAAIVIIALGVTFFKGKASDATSDASTTASSDTATTTTSNSSSTASYKDGTYKASGTYLSPGGNEKIDVSLTVKDGIVTDSSVTQTANNQNSANYQAMFKENYKPSVVGKALKDISLSRVSGSSLTSQGFNDALDTIKSQAKA